MNEFVFHQRMASHGDEGGVTVSRSETLPEGDFQIDEFVWGDVALWFVTDDKFTADERESAFTAYMIDELNCPNGTYTNQQKTDTN